MNFFILGFLFILLISCGSNEDAESKKVGQQTQKITQQTQKQEKEKFKSVGDCVKAKMIEAGLDPKSKPTAQILSQCLSSQ